MDDARVPVWPEPGAPAPAVKPPLGPLKIFADAHDDCPPCEDAAILEAAEKMRRGLRGALVGVEQLIALVTARQAGRGTDVL